MHNLFHLGRRIMQPKKYSYHAMTLYIAIITLNLLSNGVLLSSTPSPAKFLPKDTIGYVSFENFNQIQEKFKNTSIGLFIDSPEMKPMMDNINTFLKPKIDEMFDEISKETNIEMTASTMPFPQGQATLAFFVKPRQFELPDYSSLADQNLTNEQWQKIDPASLPKIEETLDDYQVLGWFEFGDQIDTFKKILNKAEKSENMQALHKTKKNIRNTPFKIFKSDPGQDEKYDTLCYGFKDDMFIISSSTHYIREVLSRMDGNGADSLASDNHYRKLEKIISTKDFTVCADIKKTIRAIAQFSGGGLKLTNEKIDRTLTLLGLNNTTWLGWNYQIKPNKQIDFQTKMLLGIDGERKGILDIITPISSTYKISPTMTKNVSNILVAHYDLSAIYPKILDLVTKVSGQNIEPFIQSSLAMTADPATGRPAVDLQKDIIGQFTSPLTMTVEIAKPFNILDMQRILVTIQLKDGEVFDQTLNRLHAQFIAMGNKELKNELLGTNIYIIPGLDINLSEDPGSPDKVQFGFAVIDNLFIYGHTNNIEQILRNQRRNNTPMITSDPLYQHVFKSVPDRAGIFFYDNSDKYMEYTWWMISETQKAQNNSSESVEANPLINLSSDAVFKMIADAIGKDINFTNLPPYDSIKKYFGAAAGYGKVIPEGLYFEGHYSPLP